MSGVTILEGPDGSGKSTLATSLAGPEDVFHHGPYPELDNPAVRYLASLRPRQLWAGHLAPTVLDRSWLSEPIYGRAMRGGADRVGVARRRMLERVALGLRGVVVVCLPTWETSLRVWDARYDEEYVRRAAQLRSIHHAYARLAAGKERCDLPIVAYDYESTGLGELRALVAQARPPRNRGPGIGRWAPEEVTLLVGERVGPRARSSDTWDRLPFVDLTNQGCSAWLAERLEEASVPESALYWVNALTRKGDPTSPRFLERLRPKRVVALGEVATQWCRLSGLTLFDEVPHPMYWKRFRFNEPYPLLEVLKDDVRD